MGGCALSATGSNFFVTVDVTVTVIGYGRRSARTSAGYVHVDVDGYGNYGSFASARRRQGIQLVDLLGVLLHPVPALQLGRRPEQIVVRGEPLVSQDEGPDLLVALPLAAVGGDFSAVQVAHVGIGEQLVVALLDAAFVRPGLDRRQVHDQHGRVVWAILAVHER